MASKHALGSGGLHLGGGGLHLGSERGVCIQGGGLGDPPPRYMGYYGYGQRAGGAHPTGMHSCLN